MNEQREELYRRRWEMVPTEEHGGITRREIARRWGYDITNPTDERLFKYALADVRAWDNGDGMILYSEPKKSLYYRTADKDKMRQFLRDRQAASQSYLGPTHKIRRILGLHEQVRHMQNHLQDARTAAGMLAADVVRAMREYDTAFDKYILSKLENDRCRPTPRQLMGLCKIYGRLPHELIG
jgi:hypothetical protein